MSVSVHTFKKKTFQRSITITVFALSKDWEHNLADHPPCTQQSLALCCLQLTELWHFLSQVQDLAISISTGCAATLLSCKYNVDWKDFPKYTTDNLYSVQLLVIVEMPTMFQWCKLCLLARRTPSTHCLGFLFCYGLSWPLARAAVLHLPWRVHRWYFAVQ